MEPYFHQINGSLQKLELLVHIPGFLNQANLPNESSFTVCPNSLSHLKVSQHPY